MQLDDLEEAKELLTNIENLFRNLDDLNIDLKKQLSNKEAEQDDLLHELELGNLNAIEVGRVAKKLITVRKERRILKDKLTVISTLKCYTDDYIKKGIIADTKQTIKNLDNLKNTQASRKYTPKIIKDLKCAKES